MLEVGLLLDIVALGDLGGSFLFEVISRSPKEYICDA